MKFHTFQEDVYLNSALRLSRHKATNPGRGTLSLLMWESKTVSAVEYIFPKWESFRGFYLSAALCMHHCSCRVYCALFMTLKYVFFPFVLSQSWMPLSYRTRHSYSFSMSHAWCIRSFKMLTSSYESWTEKGHLLLKLKNFLNNL